MRLDAVRRIARVREDETAAALLSAAFFFCLLCAYYILRPLREEMGLAGGVRQLPRLYLANLAIMLAAAPAFGALVDRFPRRTFITVTYRFFMLCLLAFWALMTWAPATSNVMLGRVFYVWLSVFNMWAVSLFWAVMADGWGLERSKRVFGFIAAGGSAGGLIGAGLTALLVGTVGRVNMLLVSLLLLELAVRIVRALLARLPDRPAADAPPVGSGPGRGALEGIAAVARSPYLLGIAVYLVLYTFTSTVLYFLQAKIVAAAVVDRVARAAVFARIDFAVNALTLLLQMGVAGRLMPRIGIGATLTIVPAVTCAGFLTLGAVPTLAVLVAFQVVRRATNYALAQPARAALFTTVPPDQKYKAKSFLDTFVYRGGDAVGAGLFDVLARAGAGLAALAFMAAPVALVWGAVGLSLGAFQRRPAPNREVTR